MSIKLLRSLKSEKSLGKRPSMDFLNDPLTPYNSNVCNSIQEKLTLMQQSLEDTKLNFLSEKHQKFEKMTQIQDLFTKNQQLSKTLGRASFK